MKFASESSGSPTIRFAKRFANHPVRQAVRSTPSVCPWFSNGLPKPFLLCRCGSPGFPVVRLAVRLSMCTRFAQWFAWFPSGRPGGSQEHLDSVYSAVRPGFPVVCLAVHRSILDFVCSAVRPVSQWYAWRFAGVFWLNLRTVSELRSLKFFLPLWWIYCSEIFTPSRVIYQHFSGNNKIMSSVLKCFLNYMDLCQQEHGSYMQNALLKKMKSIWKKKWFFSSLYIYIYKKWRLLVSLALGKPAAPREL